MLKLSLTISELPTAKCEKIGNLASSTRMKAQGVGDREENF